MNSQNVLTLEGICKEYVDSDGRRTSALEKIDFSVKQGEFVSIVGPSGCGKTTLLRLIAGLDAATKGEILFENRKVVGPSPERGMVFQAYTAFPWLTVRENIAFGLRPKKGDRVREARVADWLERTGLSEFADAYPKSLSGGMRQRMALARTMIVEPKLLLLDEPLGALDQRTREKLQLFLFKVVSESRCTGVLITHDIREAVLLSDRTWVMSARPGRFIDIIESDLPKPRNLDQTTTSEFSALHTRISNALAD